MGSHQTRHRIPNLSGFVTDKILSADSTTAARAGVPVDYSSTLFCPSRAVHFLGLIMAYDEEMNQLDPVACSRYIM